MCILSVCMLNEIHWPIHNRIVIIINSWLHLSLNLLIIGHNFEIQPFTHPNVEAANCLISGFVEVFLFTGFSLKFNVSYKVPRSPSVFLSVTFQLIFIISLELLCQFRPSLAQNNFWLQTFHLNASLSLSLSCMARIECIN